MHGRRAFPPEGLTDAETAAILGCSITTVRRMRYKGQLPWIRIGTRGVRVPRRAVERLLQGSEQQQNVTE